MEKLNYGTMEKIMVLYRKLWNFDLQWKNYHGFMAKNYGTMEKTIVIWKNLCYYIENYGTSIFEEK